MMTTKVYSWKKQLDFGKSAERDFLSLYHEPLILSPNLKHDFTVISTGERLELKTDDWEMSNTPNFFLERYSNHFEETPGGPWRARKHRVNRFVYYFIRDGVYFEFKDLKKLCARADKYIRAKKLKPIFIKNVGWITSGYKIPRDELADLYIVHKLSDELGEFQ